MSGRRLVERLPKCLLPDADPLIESYLTMATPRSVDAKLARLREWRGQPCSPQLLPVLSAALRDSSNLVAAEAAELVGEARVADLAPALVESFERFLDNPVKKDKQCRAKIAIVEALNKLEFADEGFYGRGLRYAQREPVWGGARDTAVPVRVACAFGLVRLRHRGVLPLLVDLLADPEKGARVGAVQALVYSGTEAAGLLLRLKARVGDPEPEVVGECLGGFLELCPEQGVAFVAEFLGSAEAAIQEAALLALGSSRQPAVFEVLKSFAEHHPGELQEVAFVALALLRLPAATDHLLGLLADASPAVAPAVLNALAVQRYDPRVCERAAAAVAQNGDAALRALYQKRFGTREGPER
jgi:HEAT repeat protein